MAARKAAAHFEVSVSAAIKLMQRVRQTGSTMPAKIGGYRRPLSGYEEALRALTETRKAITFAELRDELVARGAPSVSITAVWEMFGRIGLSHKKWR
jgi:transposase